MSINDANYYAISYSTNVSLLLQNSGYKLRNKVDFQGGYQGKQVSPVDQVGALNARRVTGRYEPIGRVDSPADRRWIMPSDFDLPQMFDSFDKLRMFSDPKSKYVMNGYKAMGRAEDDEVIAAFFADAKTGETGGTTTTFGTTLTTSAGQNVSVNTGGTASGMNVAKIREGRRQLMENEVDFETEEVFLGVTAKEYDALFSEIQVTSLDFNERPVMVNGKITEFLGIKLVHLQRLTTATDDASGTSRQCPMWVKSGMHLGEWGSGVYSDITQRKDLKGHPWQSYIYNTVGATRLEEKKVVRIWCR